MFDFLKSYSFNQLPFLGKKPESRRFQETLRKLPKEILKDATEIIQVNKQILDLYLDHVIPSERELFFRHHGVITFSSEVAIQHVNAVHEHDMALFHKKREVARFTLSNCFEKRTRTCLGDIGEYQLSKDDLKWISETKGEMKKDGEVELDLAHSHTVVDLLIFSPRSSKLIAGGLSKEDIRLAEFLKTNFNLKVTISALLQSGLQYQALIKKN